MSISQTFPQSGNAIIDRHHAELSRLVSRLSHAWIMDQDMDTFKTAINLFISQLQDHFETEISIIRSAGFAGWERHESDHNFIIRQMTKLADTPGEDFMYQFIDEAERTVFEHELLGDQEYWAVLDQSPVDVLISWDDSLLVHDEAIDKHHLALVNLLNRLYNSLSDNMDQTVFLDGFMQIYGFTKIHFEHEENQLGKVSPAIAQAHIRDHARLLAELRRTIERFRKEPSMEDARVLMRDFVRFWLTDHIIVYDKPFFDQQG
ncbi:hypothetical protein JCM17960_26570 [Magnetospira thiophila]